MSTKIYSAYRIPANTNLFDFKNKVQQLLKEPILEEITTHAAGAIIRLYDALTVKDGLFYKSAIKDMPGLDMTKKIDTVSVNDLYWAYVAKCRDSEDYNYVHKNAHLNFMNAESIGSILVTIRSSNRSEDLFKTIPGVEDFRYWDNTDKPDSISKKEWKNRRKVWNEVIEKAEGVLSMQVLESYQESISYKYFKQYDFMVPDFHQRLFDISQRYLGYEYFRTHNRSKDLNEIFRYLQDDDNRSRSKKMFENELKVFNVEQIRTMMREGTLIVDL